MKRLIAIVLLLGSLLAAQEIRRPTVETKSTSTGLCGAGTIAASGNAPSLPNFYDASGEATSSTGNAYYSFLGTNITASTYSGFAAASGSYSSLNLITYTSCSNYENTGTANSWCGMEYSLNNGSTWTTIWLMNGASSRALTRDTVALPASQDLPQLKVRYCMGSKSVDNGDETESHSIARIVAYDIRTEGASASNPVIQTASLPAGVYGQAYSQTLTVAYGTAPFTWSINGGGTLASQGAACAGLSLSSGGVTSGTPTTTSTGTCSFTVKVTDANTNTDTKALSILVYSTPSFTTQPTVAWVSPSSIAASFAVNSNVSVQGKCGTASGGPYTLQTTPVLYTQGWQRADFTGTPTNWGHAVAITGLHQNTHVYCVIEASNPYFSATSAEFSGTTTTLSTIPVTIASIAPMTRVNDQYNGAHGMPNNGFWFDGDTEMATVGDDGVVYGTCHDCYGVNGQHQNTVAWVKWSDDHLTAWQMPLGGGDLNFALHNVNWTDTWMGGAAANANWETWGIQSVRGQIYTPLWRCGAGGAGPCGSVNMIRSPDHFAHSISAGNQAAQGLGSNSVLAVGADVPVSPSVMPNNPLANNAFMVMFGPIQSCQDESINCVAQGNNDGYVYNWGICNGFAALTRVRVEDLPLMDAAKWQVYDADRVDDDGIYDAAWTTCSTSFPTHDNTKAFSGYGALDYLEWWGDLPNSQFVPDFNRWLFFRTISNTDGGAVTLFDCGPYPWGWKTPIGSTTYDETTWSNYFPSFGQILPGSYQKISGNPLNARLVMTTTGTINGPTASAGANGSTDQYSPFLTKVNLVSRTATNRKPQVSGANQLDTHILNGLDVFYDFRGESGVQRIPNLSPNDVTGAYSIAAANMSFPFPATLFGPKGFFGFGYEQLLATRIYQPDKVITTPYSANLSAMTMLFVFQYSAWATGNADEVPLAIGTGCKIYRGGTNNSTWYIKLGSTTLGPVAFPAGSPYVAVAVRWDGSDVKVYSSAQIPVGSYTLPLPTLTSGISTGPVTGTLYLGAEDGAKTHAYTGTFSNLLIYNRPLSDAELIREMTALRRDMASRGVTLP